MTSSYVLLSLLNLFRAPVQKHVALRAAAALLLEIQLENC